MGMKFNGAIPFQTALPYGAGYVSGVPINGGMKSNGAIGNHAYDHSSRGNGTGLISCIQIKRVFVPWKSWSCPRKKNSFMTLFFLGQSHFFWGHPITSFPSLRYLQRLPYVCTSVPYLYPHVRVTENQRCQFVFINVHLFSYFLHLSSAPLSLLLLLLPFPPTLKILLVTYPIWSIFR